MGVCIIVEVLNRGSTNYPNETAFVSFSTTMNSIFKGCKIFCLPGVTLLHTISKLYLVLFKLTSCSFEISCEVTIYSGYCSDMTTISTRTRFIPLFYYHNFILDHLLGPWGGIILYFFNYNYPFSHGQNLSYHQFFVE